MMRFRKIMALSLVVASIACVRGSAGAADATAALIEKQSQAFSDASASGNNATLARLLDDHVVFINENGDESTKKDFIGGPLPAPTRGVSQTLRQTDWEIHLHGNVAVTAFTDVSTLHFHGQIVVAKFRSTEVWLEERAGWRMISSQTLALQNDPPAVTLPSRTLEGYVGTYTAGPGYAVVISRAGNDLAASVNGGPPATLKAELADVFFVPGMPRLRRIFQRDGAGRVTGFVSRREGRDVVLTRTS